MFVTFNVCGYKTKFLWGCHYLGSKFGIILININQILSYTFWGCIFLGKGYPSLRWLKKRCHTILIFYYMYRNATHALAAVSIVKFSIRFVWLQTKFPWKILISRSRDCQKPSDWNQLRTSPVFSNIQTYLKYQL